jgi:hypothetical protein
MSDFIIHSVLNHLISLLIMKYLILLILLWSLMYLTKITLISDELYFGSYSDKLGYDQIKIVLDNNKKWEWLAYCLIPIIYIVKCGLVTLTLLLGLFFTSNQLEFKRIFKIAVCAEFVFIVPSVVRLLWFLFIQTTYTLQDLQYFYPLSALNMFDQNTLEPWLIYPLQVFNVFEIIYCIALAYFLSKELPELDMDRSMMVVMSSYGTGLVAWVAFVMFLTLTYT